MVGPKYTNNICRDNHINCLSLHYIPVEYEERALEEFESFLFFGAVDDTIIHIQPLINTLMCLVV